MLRQLDRLATEDKFSRCLQELRQDLLTEAYWGFEPDNSLLGEQDMLVRTFSKNAVRPQAMLTALEGTYTLFKCVIRLISPLGIKPSDIQESGRSLHGPIGYTLLVYGNYCQQVTP